MPITPLHFGLIPVLNRVTRRRMNEGAFVLANCVADVPVVLHIYQGELQRLGGPAMEGTLHSVWTHHFAGVLVMSLALGLLGFKSARWWMGCILGGLTHVALDMFVHSDVHPFMPWSEANPFYFDGAYHWFSGVLLLLFVFWLLDSWDAWRQSRRQVESVN